MYIILKAKKRELYPFCRTPAIVLEDNVSNTVSFMNIKTNKKLYFLKMLDCSLKEA
jgi:hypothetical protein